jgi:hypothetical protein
MTSTPFFFKKKIDDVSPILPRFRLLWWPENQGLYFFYPKTSFSTRFFLPKIPIKQLRNHDKPIHDLKKKKNCLKNQTQPKTKNQPKLGSIFS